MSSTLLDDPEARLDYLIDRDVLVEFDDGTVAISDDFQADLEVYEDSYLDAPDEEFAGIVASIFDVSPERAAERIEDTGMTRGELATFLALRSYLDDPERSRDELVLLTAMVAVTDPASPVPAELTELDDETFEEYIDEHGEVVVIVFKRNCAPCEGLKEDLPALLDGAPDDVAFAGIDGGDAPAFRRAFEVSVAPTTLVFSGGELIEHVEQRREPETLIETFEAVYGGSGPGNGD